MHYSDYYWDKGMPVGIGKGLEQSYRIVHDPYYRWISIEHYLNGVYERTVYDSHLLNFRHINPVEQATWQKIPIKQSEAEVICLIRNQDDRALVLETHYFEGHRCRECHARSVHGILVSVQKMYYKDLGDSFNGVVFFDSNNHPVMYKKYDIDKSTGEFTDVLEEQWNMLNISSHLDLTFCQTESC